MIYINAKANDKVIQVSYADNGVLDTAFNITDGEFVRVEFAISSSGITKNKRQSLIGDISTIDVGCAELVGFDLFVPYKLFVRAEELPSSDL